MIVLKSESLEYLLLSVLILDFAHGHMEGLKNLLPVLFTCLHGREGTHALHVFELYTLGMWKGRKVCCAFILSA